MIKRSTWILLAILVIVVGAYLIIKNRPEEQPAVVPTSEKTNLINYSDDAGKITGIRIESAEGSYISLLRNSDEQWTIQAPIAGEADQGTVTMAETQIYALGVKTILEMAQDPDLLGLNPPSYTFKIRFSNNTTILFEVGGESATGDGYYVRMGDKIYVVYKYNIDALINLLKSPPYAATPTPLPLTETPTPVPPTETLTLIPPTETPTKAPTDTLSPAPETITPTVMP